MLTTAALTSSSDAANYYAKDNYYTKERGVEESFWFGQGAQALALSGQVDPDRFQELLSGKISKETQLGRRTERGIEHRPGWDFTFSAPKSVSLLSEVYGVTQVRALHEKAVKHALQYAEDHLLQSRVMVDGKLERINTANIVCAAFTHDVSREQDPQLHTHSIILNATQTPNGWRSVSNEQLFKQKKKLSSLYRQYLFDGLRELGFTLRRSHVLPGEVYEIAGMSDSLLEAHSNRAKQIKEYIEARGLEYTPALARAASIRTRKQKQTLAPEDLRQKWHDYQMELEKQGIGITPFLAKKINGLQSNDTHFFQIHRSQLNAPLEINQSLGVKSIEESFEWNAKSDVKGVVDQYVSDWLTKKSLDTLMVLDKDVQHRVNMLIRNQLKIRKIIESEEHGLRLYENKYLSSTEKSNVANYRLGDLIQLKKGGQKYTVKRVEEKGILFVKEGKLDFINFKTEQPYAVYHTDKVNMSVGDKVRLTDNLPDYKFKKNFIGIVKSISEESITLVVNGKSIALSRSQPLPIDFGYTRVINKGKQIKKFGSVLLESEEDFFRFSQLTNQKMEGHYAYTTESVQGQIMKALNEQQSTHIERVVDNAITHLMERSQSFTLAELNIAASYFSEGMRLHETDIAKVFHRKIKDLELLPAPDHVNEAETLWTTPASIEKERYLDEVLSTDFGTLKPIVTPERAELSLNKTKLNTNQQQAIAKLLSSKNRFNVLQGDPGVGKTFALNAMKNMLNKKGYDVFAMAPTHQAVSELKDSLNIDAITIDRYLVDKGKQKQQGRKKDVWLVDESSMATLDRMTNLIELAIEHDSRVVFVGDYNQLESVGAGRAFYQLTQSSYVDLAIMDKRLRQKTELSDNVVQSVLDKQYTQALNTLSESNKLRTSESEEDSIKQLVRDYLSLSKQERKETVIVAPANEQRFKIDEELRSRLKAEKNLGKKGLHVDTLADTYLTEAQKKHASNYKAGQMIRFNQDIRGIDGVFRKTLKRGSYFKILGTNPATNSLILKSDKRGEVIHFKPIEHALKPGGLGLYDKSSIELAIGDRVKWTDNQNPRVLKNTEGEVVHVDKNYLRVRLNNKIIKLSTRNLNDAHLRHNYAKTAYSVQGQTAKRVLALMEGFRKNTVNQRSFMVGLTRASHDLAVYGSGLDKLSSALNERTGDNRIARNQQKTQERGLSR